MNLETIYFELYKLYKELNTFYLLHKKEEYTIHDTYDINMILNINEKIGLISEKIFKNSK